MNYSRRKSSEVQIGNTPLGGNNPIRIQSMANVSTMDTEAAVSQAERMIEAGAEYVRFTAQGEREAQNLGEIRRRLDEKGKHTPLVADIHFNPKAADVAAGTVEKVRINPGNYVDKVKTFQVMEYTEEEYITELDKIRAKFVPFLELCRKHHTAVRIGVNHGSLSDRIMSRYGDTPEGMVASCMEFLRICKEVDFPNVVISIKASNTLVMVRTVRLLVHTMEKEGMSYPLHLGVTEAGDGEDGRIKSAVGIGTLLLDGIGDTIRVSLSEAPEAEMPVARKLRDYIIEREGHEPIIGELAPAYDPVRPVRRVSRSVGKIGGKQAAAVVADYSGIELSANSRFAEDCESTKVDFIYCGTQQEIADQTAKLYSTIVDWEAWENKSNTYPLFKRIDKEAITACPAETIFLSLTYTDFTPETLQLLREDKRLIVVLSSKHRHAAGEMRAAMHKLWKEEVDIPVILQRCYLDEEIEDLQLKAAADFGYLLLDGFADGIMLSAPEVEPKIAESCMWAILQAARVRISRTEYISCPSCGRTLYDLQATIARIKEATKHLVGLKIGIMGCIVNGPGEMADADYGYVGAGRNRISLYKGKNCVLKNIPEEEAVDRLIELIKENGDWK